MAEGATREFGREAADVPPVALKDQAGLRAAHETIVINGAQIRANRPRISFHQVFLTHSDSTKYFPLSDPFAIADQATVKKDKIPLV